MGIVRDPFGGVAVPQTGFSIRAGMPAGKEDRAVAGVGTITGQPAGSDLTSGCAAEFCLRDFFAHNSQPLWYSQVSDCRGMF